MAKKQAPGKAVQTPASMNVTPQSGGAYMGDVDPAIIMAGTNSRYGLRDIPELMESIVEQGGVIQAIEVEPIPEPVDEVIFKVRFGNRRLAAVKELNKQGANLKIPVVVHDPADALTILKRQIAENKEHATLSPMDTAVAIKQLEENGVPRAEIRHIFRTKGGRKGNEAKDASNSYINMTLSFLELPPDLQQKIHEGQWGTAAAYEIVKVARDHPEKLVSVVADAEARRLKALDRDDADEDKLNKAMKAVETAASEETKLASDLEKLKAEADEAAKKADEKIQEVTEAYKATMAKGDPKLPKADQAKERTAAKEHYEALEADAKELSKAADLKAAELAKLEGKKTKAAENAQALRLKLEGARAESPAKKGKEKGKAVGPQDVKKAASAAGSGAAIPLNAADIRRIIHDMALPGSFPMVSQLFKILKAGFAGEFGDAETTHQRILTLVSIVTGEKKSPKAADKTYVDGLKAK